MFLENWLTIEMRETCNFYPGVDGDENSFLFYPSGVCSSFYLNSQTVFFSVDVEDDLVLMFPGRGTFALCIESAASCLRFCIFETLGS